MDVRTKLFSFVVASLLAGCTVGEYGAESNPGTPDASGGNANDESSFVAMVQPLAQSNGCTGCHGGQPPTLTSFAMLQAKYKTKSGAMILTTKGAHQGNSYFNATDLAQVQSWVNGLSQ